MIQLFWVKIDQPFSSSEWQRLLSLLPTHLHATILRFKRWQDQHASLIGKVLLRHALLEFGYTEQLLESLNYNAYGKPFIDLNIPFNLSHSQNLVVLAMTNKGEVGIDLEKIRPLELKDFQSMMPSETWHNILNAKNPHQAFFNYWTLCESVVKADGRGLSVPFKSLTLDETEVMLCEYRWYVQSIPLRQGYCCHLASNWKNPTLSIQCLDPHTFF